jgi:large subunit ribosomal protein L24
MAKIRKGDEVVVLTGKDKGKRGVVLAVRDDDRILVEGINQVKKHVRPIPKQEKPHVLASRSRAIKKSGSCVQPAKR